MKKLIRFDWAIKRLLRDKANPVVLEGFLTSLLGKEIRIIDFLESEGNKRYSEEKSNRVDILAEDAEGNKILIEVQNETENEYFHRMLFGTSRIIIDHMKQGDSYDKVPKVYSINIVYFELGDKTDYVYHGYTDFLGLHTREPLQLASRIRKKYGVEEPGDIMPEYYILLANDFDKWSKTPLDQWMYFLSTSTIPEDATAPGLKEAREQLSVDRLSREEQNAYYKHLDNMMSLTSAVNTAWEDGEWEGHKKGLEEGMQKGLKEGMQKGIEEGIQKGIEEGRKRIAISMLGSGMSIPDVAKYTGISEEILGQLLP